MSNKIQAVRDMNDLLPEQIEIWHHVESVLHEIGWQYGYQEMRTPMLEKTALFKQSIGDQTDIVEKEMYTFTDSGEESLSLRPEATASTVPRRYSAWYIAQSATAHLVYGTDVSP